MLVTGFPVQAALSLTGTRLVFDGRDREASLEIRNRGSSEVLIQSWLSDPRDDDDTPSAQREPLPFAVTPPLSRLAAGEKTLLRILYQGAGMVGDRESLLHLYVLEIPQRREGRRQLNIAVRQRLNVFYRPVGLPGDPADTAARLRWVIALDEQGNGLLQVSNPTPYHAALETLAVDGIPVSHDALLAPGDRLEFALTGNRQSVTNHRLNFKALTDYGGQRSYCARLNGQASSSAHLLDDTSLQDEC
ncbi:pilus assembly protein [Pseudomonas floridensis]|uniref:Pilus assembly protein n=1 Tax=Pseudomonas floridensis TaxID=1958950 RepID=A0A1X0N7N5_9PSED|nr:molecular chaperone [Pseudomonas floridensis]ORC59771.1 pilus assembly protein [Pseudomonas floridensis]